MTQKEKTNKEKSLEELSEEITELNKILPRVHTVYIDRHKLIEVEQEDE